MLHAWRFRAKRVRRLRLEATFRRCLVGPAWHHQWQHEYWPDISSPTPLEYWKCSQCAKMDGGG